MTGPFTHDLPLEIPLSKSPLVKAIVQMRFPVIAKIDSSEGIQGFQEQLRGRYPVMRQEPQIAMPLPSAIAVAPGISMVWRLSDMDGVWMVALSRDFIAIETNTYTSRSDFVERWSEILAALDSVGLAPTVIDRLGVRYIDRLTGSSLIDDLPLLVRQEMLGLTSVETPRESSLLSNVSQSHFQVDNVQMKVSWGVLPGGATLLPGLEPVPEQSWVLDVDVFREGNRSFDIDQVVGEVRESTERAYVFFRWCVTDELLRRYGGEV